MDTFCARLSQTKTDMNVIQTPQETLAFAVLGEFLFGSLMTIVDKPSY